MKKGFTLIELLVVISIIAMILAVALPNFLGARVRARDAKRKSELLELKTALRVYYNDYARYPMWSGGGTTIDGCGTSGTGGCPVCATANFAAGGTDGCSNVYMKQFPAINGTASFRYYQVGTDDFRLVTTLENVSDGDSTASQARCPAAVPTGQSGAVVYAAADYVLCAD
ncbi:type II secretion system GspH family protein [Patescibacteria group bacterium]|nr:type II secretion system GspH family protein [Patescibacteria group bacterium]